MVSLVFGVDNVFNKFIPINNTNNNINQPTNHQTFPNIYKPFNHT
jgi:hypothetical protein